MILSLEYLRDHYKIHKLRCANGIIYVSDQGFSCEFCRVRRLKDEELESVDDNDGDKEVSISS